MESHQEEKKKDIVGDNNNNSNNKIKPNDIFQFIENPTNFFIDIDFIKNTDIEVTII
jgi:hypothetical protein